MNSLIPEQIIGAKSDSISEIILDNDETAKIAFQKIKENFLNVKSWNEISGHPKEVFKLCCCEGEEKSENLKEGDFIKIALPAPMNIAGKGYDWVKVEKLEEKTFPDEETVAFVVRPSKKPKESSSKVCHFLDQKATNTFGLRRIRNKIIAEVRGRNETINTENQNIFDNFRNIFVGFGGFMGASKLQWQSLTDGLVNIK